MFSVLFGANRCHHFANRQVDRFWCSGPLCVFYCESRLDLLRMLLFFNAATADAVHTIPLLETQMLIYASIILCSMVFLLEDGISLDGLKLGFEVANGTAMGAAVGTTAGIGEVVAIIFRLVTGSPPSGMMSSTSSWRM